MLLNSQIVPLGLLVVIVWLSGLSFWLYKTVRHYKKLVSKTGKDDLGSILEKLLSGQEQVSEHLKLVEGSLENLVKTTQRHIQKIGVIRFNPFQETGGDQSFALAILDGKDNGVILLGLHGRESTRIYLKQIEAGKSKYELSKEEKLALEVAKKYK